MKYKKKKKVKPTYPCSPNSRRNRNKIIKIKVTGKEEFFCFRSSLEMSSIVDYGYLFRFIVFEEWQAVDQNNPLWLRGDFLIEFCLYSLTQFVDHQPSKECDFTLWLSRHELLLQDNGSRLSSILSWMNVQITEQQAVLQNIASIALSAGTSERNRKQ